MNYHALIIIVDDNNNEITRMTKDEGYLECPNCGCLTNCYGNKEELNYCWHCGADMTKEANDE